MFVLIQYFLYTEEFVRYRCDKNSLAYCEETD